MSKSKDGALPNVSRRQVTEFIPDPNNANDGTQRGLKALDTSLRTAGAGRSIVVDKNDTTIAGAKTLERAVDIGIKTAIVVETTGDELVVVKRTDLDLTSEEDRRARRLAYLDNRAGELDLSWNAGRVALDIEGGLQLDDLWTPEELADIMDQAAESIYGDDFSGKRTNNNLDAMRNAEFGKGAFIRLEIGEIMTSIPSDLYQRIWNIVSGAENQQDGICSILEAGLENSDS